MNVDMCWLNLICKVSPLLAPVQSFMRFDDLIHSLFFKCQEPYLITCHSSDGLNKIEALLYERLAGSMKSLPPPNILMKPSQVVCSGCCSEDSPLTLDVLFPGKSCWLHVCFPSTLKGHIHLRPWGERDHGIWKYAGHSGQLYFETKCQFGMCRQARVVLALLFVYFFAKGTFSPRKSRWSSEVWRLCVTNDESLTGTCE